MNRTQTIENLLNIAEQTKQVQADRIEIVLEERRDDLFPPMSKALMEPRSGLTRRKLDEAISRMENMIAMGGLNLPTVAVREQIASAVNVIIQVQRLRDGSRKTTHVTEVTGMDGEVVTMQDLFVLEIEGEDEDGKLITKLKSSGLRPKFFDNARQFGVDKIVMDAMEEAFD